MWGLVEDNVLIGDNERRAFLNSRRNLSFNSASPGSPDYYLRHLVPSALGVYLNTGMALNVDVVEGCQFLTRHMVGIPTFSPDICLHGCAHKIRLGTVTQFSSPHLRCV